MMRKASDATQLMGHLETLSDPHDRSTLPDTFAVHCNARHQAGCRKSETGPVLCQSVSKPLVCGRAGTVRPTEVQQAASREQGRTAAAGGAATGCRTAEAAAVRLKTTSTFCGSLLDLTEPFHSAARPVCNLQDQRSSGSRASDTIESKASVRSAFQGQCPSASRPVLSLHRGVRHRSRATMRSASRARYFPHRGPACALHPGPALTQHQMLALGRGLIRTGRSASQRTSVASSRDAHLSHSQG
jgi:hypothetical protein